MLAGMTAAFRKKTRLTILAVPGRPIKEIQSGAAFRVKPRKPGGDVSGVN
jgi:hypothetical protein